MYITKIQATINVRETEGAIRNVHYKDTGTNKRKRNQRGIRNVHYKDTGNTGHKTQNEDKQTKT